MRGAPSQCGTYNVNATSMWNVIIKWIRTTLKKNFIVECGVSNMKSNGLTLRELPR